MILRRFHAWHQNYKSRRQCLLSENECAFSGAHGSYLHCTRSCDHGKNKYTRKNELSKTAWHSHMKEPHNGMPSPLIWEIQADARSAVWSDSLSSSKGQPRNFPPLSL